MSRESFVFLAGFVVFFVSFLGIPMEWEKYILIGSGVFLMILGYSLRRSSFLRSLKAHDGERKSEMFVEQVALRETEEEKE